MEQLFDRKEGVSKPPPPTRRDQRGNPLTPTCDHCGKRPAKAWVGLELWAPGALVYCHLCGACYADYFTEGRVKEWLSIAG